MMRTADAPEAVLPSQVLGLNVRAMLVISGILQAAQDVYVKSFNNLMSYPRDAINSCHPSKSAFQGLLLTSSSFIKGKPESIRYLQWNIVGFFSSRAANRLLAVSPPSTIDFINVSS